VCQSELAHRLPDLLVGVDGCFLTADACLFTVLVEDVGEIDLGRRVVLQPEARRDLNSGGDAEG
jgi:hypothetical protein